MKKSLIAGIDIGGTKTAIALATPADAVLQHGASAFGQLLLRENSDGNFCRVKKKAKDKELNNQKWWAFDAASRTDSTVGNNLTVR